MAVWDYKRVIVYEISAPKGEQALIRPTGTFASDTLQVCLFEHNLYAIDEPGKVKVYTHQVSNNSNSSAFMNGRQNILF